MTFIDNSQAGKDAIKKATVEWLIQACMMVEGFAVNLVPVSTSKLKQSIGYQVDQKELVGYVGANTDYAVYVEFGTGEFAENGQGRKGGWVYKDPTWGWQFTYGMAPQPFLRPAFRQSNAQIQALAKEIFGRSI